MSKPRLPERAFRVPLWAAGRRTCNDEPVRGDEVTGGASRGCGGADPGDDRRRPRPLPARHAGRRRARRHRRGRRRGEQRSSTPSRSARGSRPTSCSWTCGCRASAASRRAAASARPCPAARILMLTMSDDETDLFEAIKAGASGYLLKDLPGEEVAAAVRRVNDGQAIIPPGMAATLLAEFTRLSQEPEPVTGTRAAAHRPRGRGAAARGPRAWPTARSPSSWSSPRTP